MENISHSLPKRSCAGTGYISHKSVYDDVFGGPPKFGLSTLAPRFEDYAEIFGGFHSVRSSSIPVLDLPVIDEEAGFHFDIRSPDFKYLEVFGDFGGLDFALSYEELVGHSSGGYDSSEEAWSPAESESLSVESDPSASSGKYYNLSNGDHLQSSDDIKLFNVSYHMSNRRCMESIATESTHVTQLPAISRCAYTFNDVLVSQMSEEERSYLHVSNDLDSSAGCGWTSTGEELFIKGLSHPSNSDSKHDLNFLEKHGKLKSTLNKPFITISDISLRTKPSGRPPPSRPPPAFAVKNGDSDRQNATFKALNDSTLERNDSSSLFFDVEVDSSSSAKAMKDATEKAQTKESVDRNEGLQSHINLHLDNDIELESKTSKTLNVNNRFKDERMPQSQAKEAKAPKPFVEEKRSLTENNKVISYSIDGKNHIHFVEKHVDTVAWSEATDLFEVIDTSLPRRASKIEDGNIMVENMRPRSNRLQEEVGTEAYDLMEGCKNNKVAKKAPEWDEDRNQLETDMDICDWDYNQGRLVATKKSSSQEREEEVQLDEMICKFDFIERKTKVVQQHGRSEKVLVDPDESVDKKLETGSKRIESEMMCKDARSRKEKGTRLEENIEREECKKRLEEVIEHTEPGKRAREKLEQEEREKRQQNACEKEENNKNKLSRERKEKNNTIKETFDQKGNEKILEGAVKHERSDKNSNVGLGKGKKCRDEQLDSKAWGGNERLVEAHKQEDNEMECRGIAQSKNSKKDQWGDHESQESKERLSDAHGREESEMGPKECWTQKDDNRSVMIFKEEEILKRSQEACDIKRNENLSKDTGTWDELSEQDIEIELIEVNGHEGEVRNDQEKDVLMETGNFDAFDGGCKYNEGKLLETPMTRKYDSPGELKATRTAIASEENTKFVTERKISVSESNDGTKLLFKGKFNSSTQNRDGLQDENGENNFTESPCLPECITNSKKAEACVGNTCYMPEKSASEIVSNHESKTALAPEEESRKSIKGVLSTINTKETNDRSISGLVVAELVQNGKKMVGTSSVVSEEREKKLNLGQQGPSHSTERKEKNLNETLATKDRKVDGRLGRERELENEHLRKLEEEREREREREKDRMSLGREALEAHERSYAEARERAERAAVERATSEARQRAMSDARERLDRTSMEARLRAELTPVERTAVEAWQRAVKKSLVKKNTFEVQEQVERSITDRFLGPSRCAASFRNTGNLNGLRYSYSSAHVGDEGESPQRCRARLERYQRTAERAAKALAEKNMRDLLALREQEERNRVAETLDVEVKRWSSGKEGNLRALLSTLQYILGPNSGWQPIPLTEVITSAAVKRAYRKATLCVHPDKLQQRGATIQQKYTCEKVFDLLKEAWNMFTSEER
ncbi:auxilin-like protein 1 isoform X2 [Olea europaea var. sylvestris]|uniref:auxilin-like protein 1 isoform X2 n=1 Tax=Olea europaea var. sylvestris TaxID=158386 RepID=UPI000C1D205A|nr:auxilin-like protein 1 isoform X2 [Olea europaea var. sylvestris]